MKLRRALVATLLAAAPLGCGDDPNPAPADAGSTNDLGAVDAGVDAGADAGADAGVDVPTRPPDPIPYAGPDDWCPGQDHCASAGATLEVGAAREDINPTLVETQWEDRNSNGLYDEGEPFTDTNGNGRFDAVWVAGYSNGRPATGVHDDLEVRALALRSGDTTVVYAVVDCVGLMITETDRIRADPSLAGLGIDRVIVSSTHVHEGVDTLGLWGVRLLVNGRDPAYMARVRERTATAIRRAVADLRPARMRVAQVVTADPMTRSTLEYVNDTRDPVLYDPTVTIARFTEAAAPDRTIATWVNWAAHPEYTGARNTLLSADYVHALRETLEDGLPVEAIGGLGGVTVFSNGPLGGQVGPGGGVRPRNAMGEPVRESGFERAQSAGRNVARLALSALAREGTDVTGDVTVSYRSAPIYARAENRLYGIAYTQGVFDREISHYDPTRPLTRDNPAWVRSRVTYLQVGPLATVTAPGELNPELWVGYDPMWSWGQPVLTETENRPDLSMAPAAPYLRELMLANPGVRWAFVTGLGDDFLGYIIARFNFVVAPVLPYLAEAAGDHYEETNSIGPDCEAHLQRPMMELARWRSPSTSP